MDELKKIKKDLKQWEGEFEKEKGRKPGKDDINSKNEIKELYRRYIDLKKASSGSHGPIEALPTNNNQEKSLAKEIQETLCAKETGSIIKETFTTKEKPYTEDIVTANNEKNVDCDNKLTNVEKENNFIPVSILKNKVTVETELSFKKKTVCSEDEESCPKEACAPVDDAEEIWGSSLSRAAEKKRGMGVESSAATEKKTSGSLFDKIGKRMLSKAMQTPKLKCDKYFDKSRKASGSTNRGSLTKERINSNSFQNSSDKSYSKTNLDENAESTPSKGLHVFEKAFKLSNTKPSFSNVSRNETVGSSSPQTSFKSRMKSYSQIPDSLLSENLDDIDGPWNKTDFPISGESEKDISIPSPSVSSVKNDIEFNEDLSFTKCTELKRDVLIPPSRSSASFSIRSHNVVKPSCTTHKTENDKRKLNTSDKKLSVSNESPSFAVPSCSVESSSNLTATGKRKLESSSGAEPCKRRKIKKSLSGEPLPDVIWDNETIDPFENNSNDKYESGSSEEEDSPVKKPTAVKAKPKKSIGGRKPMNVNDNFVMLNMKVKRYRRKGQQVSGPAYKRKMWKQKMKGRSESFGSDKCFKCGEAGHWASKCPSGKNKYNKATKSYTPEEPELPNPSDEVSLETGGTATPRPALPPIVNYEDILKPEKIVRSELKQRSTPPPPIEPVYQPNPDGSVPSTPKEVYKFLNNIGLQNFRAGQEEAVMRILSGLSTLLILSTGAGKSLCYQLPAYIYAQKKKCITLVISPLVSLMEDQVSGLPPGIKGACLHTNMTKPQREKIVASLSDGELHFLLVSPEALVAGGGFSGVLNPSKLPPIAFACIDEVHCVSEWSHHFRPSYLRVCHVLKERLGVKCILGLTATATLTTAASVAQHLGIEDYRNATIRGTTVPDNLYPSVSLDDNRAEALIQLLQDDRFASCNSIIVYCTRRDQTSRLASVIRTQLGDKTKPKKRGQRGRTKKSDIPEPDITHWDAECYHAGLSPSQRKSVQNKFMSGRLRVVVATVAFGMGLDKSDVRAVIHFNMPKTYESYVQEIGRAGRDGDPAQCHVFLDPADMNELKKHTYGNSIDRHVIKKLVRKLFPACQCHKEKHVKDGQDGEDSRLCPGHERGLSIATTVQDLDIKEEGIATLLCYLELHPKRWVENLQPTYSTCAITCYNGPPQLREIAKKCPPIAAAVALDMKHGINHNDSRSITFPIVEVSDMMGWDCGIVKREISNLQWNLNLGESGPRKSGVMVEFSDLSFHFTSHGDLGDEDTDEVVDFLHNRITAQEKTEIRQLDVFYKTLKGVAYKHYYHCSGTLDQKRSDSLKTTLREYFDSQPDVDLGNVTKLTFIREEATEETEEEEATCENETQVLMDIRSFIHTYSDEHRLTGRSIARVFQGIASPCFPPEVWGRVRRFWRGYLNVDFNLLRTMATKELIRMK